MFAVGSIRRSCAQLGRTWTRYVHDLPKRPSATPADVASLPGEGSLVRGFEREAKGLRFVFLEGGAAAGKTSICRRLANMGFRVRYENYVQLCANHPHYKPTGALITLRWADSILRTMEAAQTEYKEHPEKFKESVLILDRSLLTPFIYRRDNERFSLMRLALHEMFEAYDVYHVLCKTVDWMQRLRLAHRMEHDNGDVRKKLGEDDELFRQYVGKTYDELQEEEFFDLVVDTTDTKQATSRLLDGIGYSMELPWIPSDAPEKK